MIKITFEIDEDFIREKSNFEKMTEEVKGQDGLKAMLRVAEMIAYSTLAKKIDEGRTEFVVTPEKVDEKLKAIYDNDIPDICFFAASIKDDEPEETEGN